MISFLYKKLLWILLISTWTVCFGQVSLKTDSLYNILSSEKSDTIRARCYLELSRYYVDHYHSDSAIIFAEKGIELSKKIGLQPDIDLYRILIRTYNSQG